VWGGGDAWGTGWTGAEQLRIDLAFSDAPGGKACGQVIDKGRWPAELHYTHKVASKQPVWRRRISRLRERYSHAYNATALQNKPNFLPILSDAFQIRETSRLKKSLSF
jgi:hypothetical protein